MDPDAGADPAIIWEAELDAGVPRAGSNPASPVLSLLGGCPRGDPGPGEEEEEVT